MSITEKKYVVDAYFSNNFGDDLFLEILVKRYPEARFYFITNSEGNIINFKRNPRIKRTSRKEVIKSAKSFDAYIMIGGSMFQQPRNWFRQWLNLLAIVLVFNMVKKPCLIIGCNFGPYKSKLYLILYKSIFSKLNYISVRDQNSFYKLKSKKINLHVYPDIAFSFAKKIKEIEKESIGRELQPTVGISIMDFGVKNNDYENDMVKIISALQKKAKIKIFSFQCSNEIDDMKIIKRVMKKLSSKNIEIINYNGNIDFFIKQYKTCSSFLSTRFHSLIMSLLCGHNIIAINYNEKVKNTIDYLKLKIKSVEVNQLNKIEISDLIRNNALEREYDLDKVSSLSEKHFEYLDKLYGR